MGAVAIGKGSEHWGATPARRSICAGEKRFAKAKEEHAAVPEIGDDESPNRSLVWKASLAIWSQFNLSIKCFPPTVLPGESNSNIAKVFLVPGEQIWDQGWWIGSCTIWSAGVRHGSWLTLGCSLSVMLCAVVCVALQRQLSLNNILPILCWCLQRACPRQGKMYGGGSC